MDYYIKNHIPWPKKLLKPYGMEKFEFDKGLPAWKVPLPILPLPTLPLKARISFRPVLPPMVNLI